MELLWPWALLSLLPVAAAAWWSLRRPMQKVVLVGSLRLWERTVESLSPSATKSRHVTIAWWLLLAGAAAAGVALSRPTYYSEAPARRIAVAVRPSAELAGLPADTLAEITGAFLSRLSPADRVRLILPVTIGGSSEFINPNEAARRIRAIRCLPAPAMDLSLPEGAEDVQHLYRFGPAGLKLEDGPGTTTIALPAMPGEVTIDAFAAGEVGPGSVQVFVAVRNHTGGPRSGEVIVAGAGSPPVRLKYDLQAGGRQSLVADLAGGSEYFSASIAEAKKGPCSAAFVVRRRSVVVKVAIIGRSDPHVRRFVRVSPALRLVDDPDKADVVIAIGKNPPAGAAALVIDPPTPPEGWAKGEILDNFTLRDADVLSDHPVLAHVDLSAVAVRRAGGWRPVGAPTQKRLVSIGQNALVLARQSPPRVWLAFDTAVENTNFAITESFVFFIANVFNYFADHTDPHGLRGAGGDVTYESVTPLSAGSVREWKPVKTGEYAPSAPGDSGPLPWPGFYRDGSGELVAVSLTGLESARPDADPLKRIAEIDLPAPQSMSEGVELWGIFALIAALLWISGWAVRLW